MKKQMLLFAALLLCCGMSFIGYNTYKLGTSPGTGVNPPSGHIFAWPALDESDNLVINYRLSDGTDKTFSGASGAQSATQAIYAYQDDFTITEAMNGGLITNAGAGKNITGTFASGLSAGFEVDITNEVGINIASGGTITRDGNYIIHTFTESGTFSCSDMTVEVLVVGGGGSTGSFWGGGGGAGGLIHTNKLVTANTYSVVVGLGGEYDAPGGRTGLPSENGGDSSVFDLVAKGGGGAGTHNDVNGHIGGSGGGGCREGGNNGAGGNGTENQGYAGASAGSGGGAGGAGSQYIGGDGLPIDITGTSKYYAVGGSLGGPNSNYRAEANSGCGGNVSAPGYTTPGYSGIVVIRYLDSQSSVITIAPATGTQLPQTANINNTLISSAKNDVKNFFNTGNGWISKYTTGTWVDGL